MQAARQLTVAVIGATGFVGRHLVPELTAEGHRVRAISRRGASRPEWGPAVTPLAADVTTGEGLAAALAGAEAAVYLVAIPRPSRGRTLNEVNVGGARRAVEAAERFGIRRFVHLSALGVVDDARLEYLYSKWRGEQVVRRSSLDWVVLRPSVMWGEGDGFFNLVKTTLTWWSPGIVAIPGDGGTLLQPLWVGDLAHAVSRSLVEPERIGEVYEIGGPEHLTYERVVDLVMRTTGKRRLKVNLPVPLVAALTEVTDRVLPIFPVSRDQVRSLRIDNATDLASFERSFGRPPRRIDLGYLR